MEKFPKSKKIKTKLPKKNRINSKNRSLWKSGVTEN